MSDPNYLFAHPEEMIERIAVERGCPVQVRYDQAKKLWSFMIFKFKDWYTVAGTEDRTLLGCTTRAWQMWMNRQKMSAPNPRHS